MKTPKVLVGCPTSKHKQYCLKEYVEGVMNLSYSNYDVLLVDNSEEEDYQKEIIESGLNCEKIEFIKGVKQRLAKSRNILREKVLNKDYNYFLSLEQDVIPPKDIIEKLLAHEKEVISAVYHRMRPTRVNGATPVMMPIPILYTLNPETNSVRQMAPYEIENKGLIRIWGGGLGCLLIKKEILEKIEFRVDEKEEGYDDMYFFRDLLQNRIMAFCDTSIKCEHLERKWSDEVKRS